MKRLWTEPELQRALEMHADNKSHGAIGRELGRTAYTVSVKLRNYHGGKRIALIRNVQIFVPPSSIADRERRVVIAPRDLTASICGDPLPGYSALDRKRA